MKTEPITRENAKRPLVWLQVLIVVATAAAVGITIFLGNQTFRETKRLATEQFNQQQLILAQSAARGVESYFKELSVGLQSLTRMPQFQQMDPKCMQCMEHTYWGFPTRTSLRLLDKDGVLRFIYPNYDWRKELIGRNYSEDAFFRETAKNGHTGVHVITNERGEIRIRVAVAIYSTPETKTIEGTGVTTTQPSPIKPDPDRFCGVLVGSIDPCMIDRNLIRPIVSGRTGYAWLLDDRGVFLSHCEKDKEGQVEKLIAYAPVRIDNKVWSVAVCAPVSEVEEVIRASKRFELYTLGFVIFVLVEGGVLLLAISGRWARRLAHQVQIRTRELKETSDYLTNLIKYANAPIIVWDPDRKITIFNKAFEQMSGRHEAEMLEGSLDALFPSESRSESLRKIENTAKGQYWDNVEIPILHKDGQVCVGLWNSANIYSGDGETLVATVAQGQDITERKQAEESLRQSEKQYRAVFESAADALLIFDFEGTIVEANPAACATYGYSYDEMIGLSGKDIVHPEYHHLFGNFKKQVKATGQFFAESVDVRKDGSAFDIEIRGTSFTFKGKDHLMALVRDITERKQAEKALRESESRLRLILESASDGINIAEYDPKTHRRRLVMCNDCYVEMSGRSREELMATDDLNRFAHELECYSQPFHEQTLKGLPSMGMSCWNRPDGKENYYEWIATPQKVGDKYHIVGVDRDITDRKRAEEEKSELQEQLRQAVKMEAIGRLASGIAHDFNNMLAIIQGYADLLLKAMDAADRNRDDVERIRTAAKRAAALTRQLLAFGRRQAIRPEVLDLNEIIADTDSMLQRIIGEDIELLTKPGKDLWHVRVDPRQIEEQVILNLAVNAREAMPNGGKITITTDNIVLDEDYARRQVEAAPGEYVMLVVSDTGTGMTEEIMSHVFEPFFSTKESDKSSGLGLSTIYGIVKQSGGHIEVESTQGQGSTFRMYLPRAKKPIKSTTDDKEPDRSGRGTETILVAEDEPLVRDLLCRILRETGYTVLVASNGKEAINAATNEGKIHLLVTDVVMPHMSGKELSDQITAKHPDIKVLFVSGYTDSAISHHGILYKGVNFLAKPFTSTQLIRTVRRVLDTK